MQCLLFSLSYANSFEAICILKRSAIVFSACLSKIAESVSHEPPRVTRLTRCVETSFSMQVLITSQLPPPMLQLSKHIAEGRKLWNGAGFTEGMLSNRCACCGT